MVGIAYPLYYSFNFSFEIFVIKREVSEQRKMLGGGRGWDHVDLVVLLRNLDFHLSGRDFKPGSGMSWFALASQQLPWIFTVRFCR